MPTLSVDNILTILQALMKYGPEAYKSIVTLLTKSNPTVADVDVLFAGLKPYAAYNIPDLVPGLTVVPPPPATPPTA